MPLNLVLGTSMKNEKELLAEFIEVVFDSGKSKSDFKKEYILKFPLSGIRQAAQDALTICSHMKPSQEEAMNSVLLSRELPPISTFKNKAFKQFLKLSSKGKIANDEQWYLVRSLLDSDILNKEQMTFATNLVESYEFPRT